MKKNMKRIAGLFVVAVGFVIGYVAGGLGLCAIQMILE